MGLHPEVVEFLRKNATLFDGDVMDVPLAEARSRLQQRRALFPPEVEPVSQTHDEVVQLNGVDTGIRVYLPKEGNPPFSLIVLFHGGGWVLGDLDTEDTTARGLSLRTGSVVVSVDYRRAPEAKFPIAAEDCYAALVWATENSEYLQVDAHRVAVAGTSAGGNLSAAVALMARDRVGPLLVHQVLLCPVLNSDFATPSYLQCAEGYGLSRAAMMWYWQQYCATAEDMRHSYAAPMHAADLSGLPPATIIAAEYDPLRHEAELYSKRLAEASNDVRYNCYAGMIHGFNVQVGVIGPAKQALSEVAARLSASFK